jgi:hypothetical protein
VNVDKEEGVCTVRLSRQFYHLTSLIHMEEFQKCVTGIPSSEEYEHHRHQSKLTSACNISENHMNYFIAEKCLGI